MLINILQTCNEHKWWSVTDIDQNALIFWAPLTPLSIPERNVECIAFKQTCDTHHASQIANVEHHPCWVILVLITEYVRIQVPMTNDLGAAPVILAEKHKKI